MHAVVLIGPQASGKSSYCRERLFNSHMRLNLDMLRTRHREGLLFSACIEAKQPVVIDNTNPSKADRARYIAALKSAGYVVHGYFFDLPYEQCQARNAARVGSECVPEVGLKHFFARLERPSLDEGFEALFLVRSQDGGFLVEEFA
ncbi:AAA family ATPase [Chitinimonas naiadis]